MTGQQVRIDRLLFGLAGRLDDEELALARTAVADAEDELDLELITDRLLIAFATGALALSEAEFARLAAEAAWALEDPDEVGFLDELPLRVSFSPASAPGANLIRDDERPVLGVWLVHRADAGDPEPVPVWLVEARRGADLVELTADLQQNLAEAGEIPPRVEVFEEGEELPPYHRAALGTARLVWSDPDAEAPRLARVFDGADEVRGAYFAEGHPVVAEFLRPRLLGYLTSAEVLLGDLGRLDDVVNPLKGGVVPLGFRTDGYWVWPDAVAYYLEHHGLAPDPELMQHVLRMGGAPPRPGRVAAGLALAALTDEES